MSTLPVPSIKAYEEWRECWWEELQRRRQQSPSASSAQHLQAMQADYAEYFIDHDVLQWWKTFVTTIDKLWVQFGTNRIVRAPPRSGDSSPEEEPTQDR